MKDSISNQRWTSALWHNAMNFPCTLCATVLLFYSVTEKADLVKQACKLWGIHFFQFFSIYGIASHKQFFTSIVIEWGQCYVCSQHLPMSHWTHSELLRAYTHKPETWSPQNFSHMNQSQGIHVCDDWKSFQLTLNIQFSKWNCFETFKLLHSFWPHENYMTTRHVSISKHVPSNLIAFSYIFANSNFVKSRTLTTKPVSSHVTSLQ